MARPGRCGAGMERPVIPLELEGVVRPRRSLPRLWRPEDRAPRARLWQNGRKPAPFPQDREGGTAWRNSRGSARHAANPRSGQARPHLRRQNRRYPHRSWHSAAINAMNSMDAQSCRAFMSCGSRTSHRMVSNVCMEASPRPGRLLKNPVRSATQQYCLYLYAIPWYRQYKRRW